MERAAFITAFGIDRQIGAGLGYYKDHFTLAAGMFGESVSDAPLFPGFFGDESDTVAARATWAPINREVNSVNQVLHFGASGRWREVGDDQPFLQYAVPSGQLALGNLLNNTGRIGESDTLWALEAAGVWGPLSVQGEYAQLEVDLPGGAFIRNPSTGKAAGSTPFFGTGCDFNVAAGNVPTGSCDIGAVGKINNPFLGVPDPTYDGWYVDVSYFLTGETRPYKEGRFDRVKVKNPVRWEKGEGFKGWGAWQIAGRYDFLSLSDSAFNDDAFTRIAKWTGGCANTRLGVNRLTAPKPTTLPPDDGEVGADPARIAQCGEQESWVFGVNWYLNDHTRIMFNYIHQELSGYPVTNDRDSTTHLVWSALAVLAALQVLQPVVGLRASTVRTLTPSACVYNTTGKRNQQSPPLPDRRPLSQGAADFLHADASLNRPFAQACFAPSPQSFYSRGSVVMRTCRYCRIDGAVLWHPGVCLSGNGAADPPAPRVDALQLGTPGGEENDDVTNSGKVKGRFSPHAS